MLIAILLAANFGPGGSPFGYEIVTGTATLTSSSKRFQSCQNTAAASFAVTMPDCGSATDGYEYVISHADFSMRGSCVVVAASGDTLGPHAAWVLAGQGDSITLVCNSANNRWDIVAISEQNVPGSQWAWRDPDGAATTFVTTGQIAPTTASSGGSTATILAGTGAAIELCTTASNGNVLGLNSTAATTELSLSPRDTTFQMLIGATGGSPPVTFRWFPLASLAATPSGADALAGVGSAIRYSTGASDTAFQCCSHDGSTASCTAIPTVVLQTGQTQVYKFTLQNAWKLGTACTVQVIDGASEGTSGSVWKTSNVDATGTANLSTYSTLTTLANSALCDRIAWVAHRQGQ